MKYSVELKYTNPAHEHVSLRRRVDTITRMVEANSEEEAVNRAANQQRALGFMIREAKVVNPYAVGMAAAMKATGDKPPLEKSTIKKAHRIADKIKEESEPVNEVSDKTLSSYVDKAKESAKDLTAAGKHKKATNRYMGIIAAKTKQIGKTASKIKSAMKEEVEQVEEGIAADMLASTRAKKQKAVAAKIYSKELQDRKVARGKARQAGTMGHPANVGNGGRLKNESADSKKEKIKIALNKIKSRKHVNMQPTIDAEKA